MDVRKFAAGRYLKPADIEAAGGTLHQRIINTQEVEGKFGLKLDAWFEDITLTGRAVGELMRQYGQDSDAWLGKGVELTVEEYVTRDGVTGKTITVTPTDDLVPVAQRPRLAPLPPEKPAKPTASEKPPADMDDQIPF
jgi:hypothetical protein